MINTIYSKQDYNTAILYSTKQGWWVGVSVRRKNDTARAAALPKSAPLHRANLKLAPKPLTC